MRDYDMYDKVSNMQLLECSLNIAISERFQKPFIWLWSWHLQLQCPVVLYLDLSLPHGRKCLSKTGEQLHLALRFTAYIALLSIDSTLQKSAFSAYLSLKT